MNNISVQKKELASLIMKKMMFEFKKKNFNSDLKQIITNHV